MRPKNWKPWQGKHLGKTKCKVQLQYLVAKILDTLQQSFSISVIYFFTLTLHRTGLKIETSSLLDDTMIAYLIHEES